jgi:hypothetical protein
MSQVTIQYLETGRQRGMKLEEVCEKDQTLL